MANDDFPTPREPVIEYVELDPVGTADPSSSNPPPPTNSTGGSGQVATGAPAEKGSLGRGRLAAIGGGAAALGLVLGLLIGWFAFDDGGNGNDRHSDRGRMSQQQGPGGGHQDGGGMRGGNMSPGQGGGQMPGGGMMPGGGQMRPDNAIPIEPTTPSTPSTQGSTVPQSLQQG